MDIAGATGATYTLAVADVDATVRVLVTATNPDATIVETSAPTAPVLAAGPLNETPPTVSGTVQRGLTLTGTAGYLERHRQHHQLPVAVLFGRDDLDEPHRRDGHDVHARRLRHRPLSAPARHRHQPRRHRHRFERGDRQGDQRPAREHRPADAQRHRAARVDPDRDDRHLERQRQRLHVPVAAGLRRRLRGHRRRHQPDLHPRPPPTSTPPCGCSSPPPTPTGSPPPRASPRPRSPARRRSTRSGRPSAAPRSAVRA